MFVVFVLNCFNQLIIAATISRLIMKAWFLQLIYSYVIWHLIVCLHIIMKISKLKILICRQSCPWTFPLWCYSKGRCLPGKLNYLKFVTRIKCFPRITCCVNKCIREKHVRNRIYNNNAISNIFKEDFFRIAICRGLIIIMNMQCQLSRHTFKLPSK